MASNAVSGKPVVTPAASSRYAPLLQLAAGVVAIGAVFFWLQFSAGGLCCGDFDGYYHIKWSALLWQGLRHGHFPPAFEWLPLTSLDPGTYADQHLLFHLLLIPFTWIGDLTLGAKLAAAIFGTAAVSSLYWLIVRYRVAYPLLWLLALSGCSWMFYIRLNMTKAESLSLLFMVIGTVLLLERKYIWLFPTAFLYVWAYNLFVLLGVMAFLWVVVVGWTERRLEYKPLLWTGLGMITGFLINPYFPRNVRLFLEHLIARSGRVPMLVDVGSEWHSFATWDFLKGNFLACAAILVGYIGFGYLLSSTRGNQKRLQRPLFFLLLSSALLLMAARYVRFVEYWPPFAILFCAFVLQEAWQSRPETSLESPEEPCVQASAERPVAPRSRAGASSLAELVPLALFLAAVCLYNLNTARATIQRSTADPEYYAAGSQWLRSHVPPGAMIYDLNYSDFPKLFFYDTQHTYVSGLDPLYLWKRHPELEKLDLRLSQRQEENPAAAIRSLFPRAGAPAIEYLFVGSVPGPPSREWLNYIRQAPDIEVVYEDKQCMILHLRN